MSPEDLAKFRARFPELDAWLWDQQIAEDFAAGKLDVLIAEAREDFKAGRVQEVVRQELTVGLEEAKRGELFDGEEVIREILETLGL